MAPSCSNRLTWLSQVALTGLLLSPTVAHPQMTDGSLTVVREGAASSGGTVGGGNPMQAFTVVGEPAGGSTSNGSVQVYVGAPAEVPSWVTSTSTVTVQGTIDDASASVVVNGVTATISGTTFTAAGVRLVEGANTITVTATDPAGNATRRSITVHRISHPPARPTVASTPAATTATSVTLTGTKTADTSIWVNGTQAVALNADTSWSATVNALVEGDNVLTIVTKDRAGNTSSSATVTIVLDNLPPVITASAPTKTNLNPLTITGTVDDSLTTVNVNGLTASRTGKNFQVAVPLSLGANTVTVTATSPNGYLSTTTLSITRGSVPAVSAVQPAGGAKLYAGTSVTVSATATDAENDPMERQILLDGVVIVDWFPNASHPWTPGTADLGPHTLEVRARDGCGSFGAAQSQVYILRKPVSHP